MTLPWELSEVETTELEDELALRARFRAEGKCDYCGRTWGEQVCKFPHRHNHIPEYPPLVVVGEVQEVPERARGRWSRRLQRSRE